MPFIDLLIQQRTQELSTMDKRLKILMLEDVEEDAALIERSLKKESLKFTKIRVETRDEFTKALNGFSPDVILSDHCLPKFNSIEALDLCKQRKLDIPFILVTGAVSEEFAVNCLKRGADDYILKSNLSRLPSAIEHAIRQHRYESERVKHTQMLQLQYDELVKINKELDSFVYSVSHNLRSPLSSVLGLVNLAKLERQRDFEGAGHYFRLIESSILKLDETLHEILDYSRNSRTALEITDVDIEKIIWECFEQAKHLKGNEAIVKQIEVIQDAKFYSDAHRLSVIFNNLITNALQYRDETKIKQELRITVTINPAYASIIFQDNGIGIAAELLPNVFNMFFRGTERSQGAGLGLYIAKEMVEKMKGKIAISSVLHQRTAVSLTIPNALLKL